MLAMSASLSGQYSQQKACAAAWTEPGREPKRPEKALSELRIWTMFGSGQSLCFLKFIRFRSASFDLAEAARQ
jgi:hypothetical protein